jgi:hypothetical protein
MFDCRDNGDQLQLAFVNVVLGALFSPLAMVLSVLHDSNVAVGRWRLRDQQTATECLIVKTMVAHCNYHSLK